MTISFLSFSQDKTKKEYALKSAYLVNICKFTTWEDEDSRKNKTFKIYTIGTHEEHATIYTRKNQRIKKRDVEIISVNNIEELKNIDRIDVLYIYSISKSELEEILNLIGNKNILIVSENEGFGEMGVVINFFFNKNKINFEINRKAELKSKVRLKSFLYNVSGSKIIGDDYNL